MKKTGENRSRVLASPASPVAMKMSKAAQK
jgi:hypothetical protein